MDKVPKGKYLRVYNEAIPKISRNAFKTYLDANEFVDIVFLCQDRKKVSAHQMVLGMASAFLSKLFLDHQRSNKELMCVSIPDIRAHTMKQVIDFIYTKNLKCDYSEIDEVRNAMSLLGMPRKLVNKLHKDVTDTISIDDPLDLDNLMSPHSNNVNDVLDSDMSSPKNIGKRAISKSPSLVFNDEVIEIDPANSNESDEREKCNIFAKSESRDDHDRDGGIRPTELARKTKRSHIDSVENELKYREQNPSCLDVEDQTDHPIEAVPKKESIETCPVENESRRLTESNDICEEGSIPPKYEPRNDIKPEFTAAKSEPGTYCDNIDIEILICSDSDDDEIIVCSPTGASKQNYFISSKTMEPETSDSLLVNMDESSQVSELDSRTFQPMEESLANSPEPSHRVSSPKIDDCDSAETQLRDDVLESTDNSSQMTSLIQNGSSDSKEFGEREGSVPRNNSNISPEQPTSSIDSDIELVSVSSPTVAKRPKITSKSSSRKSSVSSNLLDTIEKKSRSSDPNVAVFAQSLICEIKKMRKDEKNRIGWGHRQINRPTQRHKRFNNRSNQ